jgi:flagellar biosynthesis GTPase FlhF
MELQRFVGKDTKSVLDEIRAALGEQALIVSNTKVGSKTEIIAARVAQSATAETQVSVDEDASKLAGKKEDFSQTMANHQRFSSPTFTEDDPWEHIRQINNEISSIKSALKESSEQTRNEIPTDLHEVSKRIAERKTENYLELLDSAKEGCHIIWGERKSGKSLLIKELIKRRASNHEKTIILRLPHTTSSDDSHLCAIAERFSVDVIFINQVESIESMIALLDSDHLILIEADLSKLNSLALDTTTSWLEKSFNFIIDENEKQTDLISELFQQINAKIPARIPSMIIEDIR